MIFRHQVCTLIFSLSLVCIILILLLFCFSVLNDKGLNISASRASGSNEKTVSHSAVKYKKTPKAKNKVNDYSQNTNNTTTTDDDSKHVVVPKVPKSKFKKKMPVKFFSDYI